MPLRFELLIDANEASPGIAEVLSRTGGFTAKHLLYVNVYPSHIFSGITSDSVSQNLEDTGSSVHQSFMKNSN